ncbi:lysophospholipid acyltransferase family protein [Solimonas sp. SE-A11]|uniref:lysophospholipid acyltransferase family protein n=1 Tax=Solimonas sp. SE-A11 TaxID=3054954 RepID=UPI00259D070A|nr:lysophospholipid acyltransferase family protein [Solimonas sp. SE-A11]MDM4769165.1 lysophospholipid acyltransferase family protein [Solimonas sp. SE-A11]
MHDPALPVLPPFTPPSPQQMRRYFALARRWFLPEFLGLWELDLRRPALFVGNHTLFGLTDAPLMIEHLYTQYGVMLRGLGDRGHFQVPYWGEFLARNGMVLGTPENCAALMRAGEHVLVFPGGGREVMRRRGEAYRLIWKRRSGFARLAIEHGYDIIPFGSVGPDESYRILLDANDVQDSRAWRWLSRQLPLESLTRGGDMIPPLVRGLGPSLLPRPQRYYFGFGPRIATTSLRGLHDDPAAAWALREQVAGAVEQQISRLLRYRREDRQQSWSLLRRWLAPLQV